MKRLTKDIFIHHSYKNHKAMDILGSSTIICINGMRVRVLNSSEYTIYSRSSIWTYTSTLEEH